VVLCTDGRSNIGLGGLLSDATVDEIAFSKDYYHRLAQFAMSLGVAVHVVRIEVCI
jgi:hypothetical protein